MQWRGEVGSLQSNKPNRDFSLLRLLYNRTNRTGISLSSSPSLQSNKTKPTLLGSIFLSPLIRLL
uniref:Uncharacterized protein n=1 Tax=Nelumbo nucifera TaxID=4432 RepID=A0A822YNX2_NELNU|nr:TPA_asm: hypothetical protein HUJ06_011880 [Nelumbo nucifera]